MKRLLALTLAFVMMLSLFAGCSKTETETTASSGSSADTTTAAASDEPYGVFNNYFLADVDTINPHTWTMSDSGTLISLTSMNLYRYAPTETGDGFIFTTELPARDTEQVDEEGKLWNIKILEDANWQKGGALTIDDVIYS